jgi:DNA-binding beta-propeller fold protein YncE
MDLLVSTNDAKYHRDHGRDTFPPNPPPDTLSLIDASSFPPVVVATIPVATSIAGPPQAVALTPDARLAVVSASNRYDPQAAKIIWDTFLQVVDLEATPPQVIARVEVGHHPQGLAINRDGTLLLAATVGGTVAVLAIRGRTLTLLEEIKVSSGRLAGVVFTTDGTAALVTQREEQGLIVLSVHGTRVSTQQDRVTTGVSPYAIDVSSDGRWAVVGNVGLAGIPGLIGRMQADADTITLIDVSSRPFRAVQHLTVPSVPEGVAISPDGRWIAALTMDGSNLPPDHPRRRPHGRLVLFEIREGWAHPADNVAAGEAGQGVVFTADSRYLLAQYNVEKQIAVFEIRAGKLHDTGERMNFTGGPVSIRSRPR